MEREPKWYDAYEVKPPQTKQSKINMDTINLIGIIVTILGVIALIIFL